MRKKGVVLSSMNSNLSTRTMTFHYYPRIFFCCFLHFSLFIVLCLVRISITWPWTQPGIAFQVTFCPFFLEGEWGKHCVRRGVEVESCLLPLVSFSPFSSVRFFGDEEGLEGGGLISLRLIEKIQIYVWYWSFGKVGIWRLEF